MRVLWWSHDFWPSIGGTAVLGGALIGELEARGHRFAVVTQETADGHGDGVHDGRPVFRFPFHAALAERDVGRIAEIDARLRGVIRGFRPDLVHLHHLTYLAFFCERTLDASRAPLIVTRHELFRRPPAPDSSDRRILGEADWVACCSGAVLNEVRGFVPEVAPRSSVILNGLDPPPHPPSQLPQDPPVLLGLGRLVEQKGFDLAIEALPAWRGRFPDVRLVLAGEGPERPNLERAAMELGVRDAVDFRGWIDPDQVPRAIDGATIVLAPSRSGEGFGLTALEAALMARPVVAARTGGLPEVVEDGSGGALFEPGDVDGLAEAVLHLLSGPKRAAAMGRRARRRALKEFGMRRFTEEYDRLYRSVGRQGRRPDPA